MTMKMLPSLSARTSVLSWRRRLLASVLSPLLAIGSLLAPVHAQTSAVPSLISYQGKVTNANGTLVGASPSPVNRKVTFRIWSHQSNSTINDLVYSEEQTVTISDGEFSVLIGQGTTVTGTPLGYSETAKGPNGATFNVGSTGIFGGATRYLGVTIDDGNAGTADPEISPRQQLVSSAYAFRAKYAEALGSNGASSLVAADNGFIGIGAANPAAKLDVAGNIRAGGVANASFVLANADNNAVGTVGTASSVGSLSTDAAINDVVVRASAGKLLLQSGVGASGITIDTSNRVGIGTSAPNAALDVNGALMLKGALTGSSGRPTVGASRVAGEIGGYSSTSPFQDDGFLRLSAGGGTTASAKSFIDLTGFSNVTDMDKTLVFGTAGAERLRISNSGALLLKGGLTNANLRPAVGSTRITSEIHGYSSGGVSFDDGFLRLSAGGGTNGNTKSFIDLTGFATTADMDKNLVFGTAGTERMRIDGSGNVGIGTNSPGGTRLYVSSPTATAGISQSAVFLATGIGSGTNASHIHYGPLGDIYWRSASTGGKVVLQDSGGNVQIGSGSDTVAKLIVHGGPVTSGLFGPYINSGGYAGAVSHGGHQISIYASHSTWTGGTVIVTSDERTKRVLSRSDAVADLATLRGIEITNFKYKDAIAHGDAVHKKVIAQQVERVFPQAISLQTESVPDIYTKAVYRDGWIQLANELKPGERVRLIDDKADGVYEVLEAKPDGFRTAFVPATDTIFVFGRQVKDFRTVDYDAISMLNVSATQELARENDALKRRVAELEAKDRARDVKIAAIEKLLSASSTVMAQPAKPATANGQE